MTSIRDTIRYKDLRWRKQTREGERQQRSDPHYNAERITFVMMESREIERSTSALKHETHLIFLVFTQAAVWASDRVRITNHFQSLHDPSLLMEMDDGLSPPLPVITILLLLRLLPLLPLLFSVTSRHPPHPLHTPPPIHLTRSLPSHSPLLSFRQNNTRLSHSARLRAPASGLISDGAMWQAEE